MVVDVVKTNNPVSSITGEYPGKLVIDQERSPQSEKRGPSQRTTLSSNSQFQGDQRNNRMGPPQMQQVPQNNQGNSDFNSPPPPQGDFSGGSQQDHQARFIAHLDQNGDDRISKNEFQGPPDHFLMFDKDGDGYIVASEAPQSPPPRPRQ